MRSKRTIKPVKIFDNSVTNSNRNKNNQKNSTNKKRNIISNEMDDLNDAVDVEGGNGAGDSNGGKDDENIGNQNKGYRMSVHELRYHIRRMWSKWGVDDIDMKNDGTCMFKFRNEAGMNKVLELGPMIVNNKPILVNVPLEAWSKEGISALASSLGKPLIMDTMIAKRCSLGEGRMDFARILVEFDVMKGFKEEIEIQYRDKENNKKERSVDELEKDARKKEELIRKKNEENDEIRNKRDIWKRKEGNEGKNNNSRGKEKEKKGNDKDEGDGVRSRNKFEVLNGMDTDNEELDILKGGMIVDVFLIKKTQPSCIDVKDWTQDMMQYYKKQLEINKLKNMEDGNEDIEDVLEANSGIAKDLSTKELEGMDHLLCLNEYFVYASNSCTERRGLWDDLRRFKAITSESPWILMGDFNVTLNLEEHSAGGSRINGDMQEFRECVHDIEVDDINCTGLFYTWIKSPSKPETNIPKKLDRVMVNSEFIDVYGSAYSRFHPFLISDHSLVVIHLPNTLERKKKSFKFSNFVADKAEFLDVVKKNGNNVKKLEEELKRAQVDVEASPNCKVVKEKLSKVVKENYFHNVVKSRMHSNRIMRVCDDKGKWFEGDDVADQFVKHFERFPVGNKEGVSENTLGSNLDKHESVGHGDCGGVGRDKAPECGRMEWSFTRCMCCFKEDWDIVDGLELRKASSRACDVLCASLMMVHTVSIDEKDYELACAMCRVSSSVNISGSVSLWIEDSDECLKTGGHVRVIKTLMRVSNLSWSLGCQYDVCGESRAQLYDNELESEKEYGVVMKVNGKQTYYGSTEREYKMSPQCYVRRAYYTHEWWGGRYERVYVTTKMGKRNWDNVWEKVACTISKGGCKSNIKCVLDRMEFATTIYFVWNERNKRIFTQEQRNCQDLLNGIVESIKMQLMSLKVKKSLDVEEISKEWNIMNIIQLWEEPFLD
ncbi:RNA-directed DNA polymerase, eukaryota, reverse transcriptase zinc-binding domain protein [Tanacetum coccineum]